MEIQTIQQMDKFVAFEISSILWILDPVVSRFLMINIVQHLQDWGHTFNYVLINRIV